MGSKLKPVERVVVQTEVLRLTPQLANRPDALNLPAFDNFEVIVQGDDGAILSVLRRVRSTITDEHPLAADVDVFIESFEKGALTLAIRGCDTRKPGCKKNPDGSLEFPGPLDHMALTSSDYLQMGKAWSEIRHYVKSSEWKFREDQRRVDALGKAEE